MVFGKIQYLNLLPFHVFMKRFTKSTQQSMSMEYKRSVPAKVNISFHNRRVDAAFISSISATKSTYVRVGIIAKKEVKSVIVIPSDKNKRDIESASSNVLAAILKIKGEILIGDKALKYAISNSNYIDLAQVWSEKHNLPFVFAVLCYHKDKKLYKTIEREFTKTAVKIPQYILQNASKQSAISTDEITQYLKLISYKIDKKAELGLKKFYKEAKKL